MLQLDWISMPGRDPGLFLGECFIFTCVALLLYFGTMMRWNGSFWQCMVWGCIPTGITVYAQSVPDIRDAHFRCAWPSFHHCMYLQDSGIMMSMHKVFCLFVICCYFYKPLPMMIRGFLADVRRRTASSTSPGSPSIGGGGPTLGIILHKNTNTANWSTTLAPLDWFSWIQSHYGKESCSRTAWPETRTLTFFLNTNI